MPDKSSADSTSAVVSATLRQHTAPMNERTEAIIAASKSLESQRQGLLKDTERLSRQTDALEKAMNENVDQLKEMGDLQNWAEVVFRDISIIEETLKAVEEQENHQTQQNGDGNCAPR